METHGAGIESLTSPLQDKKMHSFVLLVKIKKEKKKKKKNKKNKINIRDQFLQIEDAMYWARVLAWPKDEMVDRGVSDKHCCLLT